MHANAHSWSSNDCDRKQQTNQLLSPFLLKSVFLLVIPYNGKFSNYFLYKNFENDGNFRKNIFETIES